MCVVVCVLAVDQICELEDDIPSNNVSVYHELPSHRNAAILSALREHEVVRPPGRSDALAMLRG